MPDSIAKTSAATIVHLRRPDSDLLRGQASASSGAKLSNAADNTVFWSIATAMRADHRALSSSEDALGLDPLVVDGTTSNLGAAIDVMDKIKFRQVAAREQRGS